MSSEEAWMKRAVVGVCALALAGVGLAGTSSNVVLGSTAAYQTVTVTGATMKSITYTLAANTIAGFTITLKGSVTLKTMTAHFASGPSAVCVFSVPVVDTVATCTGLNQRANASWRLTITVS
jgi:hypothetical protein